ncbi:MAG: F0F1 ATP synthase subunit B [Shewanellaceae bacterium]|nr:F0F1 ATP synthase subunit B [Shewanellaceae bacterium]
MDIGATLVGQTIAFILFVWFCMKHVWPPLIQVIEERQQKIADGLRSADQAEKELALVKKQVAQQMADAKQAAQAIVEQASQRKVQIIDEARQEADIERKKIISQGELQIEAERNRAKEELRQHVGMLAMSGAERILERSIENQAQDDIVKKLVAEI